MKLICLFAALVAFTSVARAVDTTPPTLDITHTWIEKQGSISRFRMLLDPQDETGLPGQIGTIFFRSALNKPAVNLSGVGWNMMPWTRGVPFDLAFTCTACVIELQARDAAGNASPIQRRVFQSPFPYKTAPNLSVKLENSPSQGFTGAAIDCRGLFVGNLDSAGIGDDILQVDRISGNVTARERSGFPVTNTTVVSVAANTIEDSAAADYDKDGRLDLAMVISGAVRLYHNDGVNGSGVLVFSEVTLSPAVLPVMNLATHTGVAFADISGEGKPDLIVSGTSSGGEVRVGWLANNSSTEFQSGSNARSPAGSGPGRVAAGDVNGDGTTDVVMIDTVQKGLILFQNYVNNRLVGEGDTVPTMLPIFTATGPSFEAMLPQALAVGDVTGDGRADAVVMMHWWVSTNPGDSNDTRMHPLWQVLDSRGASGLHAQQTYRLPEGPFAASPTTFGSDVILRDLNNDRFPEIIVTSQFEPGTTASGGIHAFRITPFLDATNRLTSFDIEDDVVVATNLTNPHRLAAARFSGNTTYDIVLANNDATLPIDWIVNTTRESTAPVAIIGGAATDSDPDGTDGPNGTKSYTVYPSGLIEYSLTLINNTASPLTNAIFDSLLPPTVNIEDPSDGAIVPSGTSKYVRWTETIPAHTAITKHFTARLLPTAVVGAILSPKNSLKYGSTTVYSYMPKVTLDEPINFELLSVNSESDATGAIVHYGEGITYRMRLTNRGKTAINNTIIGMNIPTGSIFDGPLSAVPGTTQVLSSGNKRIDITVTTLGPETYQDMFVNVEARGADKSLITNSTMTAQRPSGSKRTLAAVNTTVQPAIDLEWYSVYSEFDPRQPALPTPPLPEPLKGSKVHFGEIIRYRLKIINRSSIAQTGLYLVIPVPKGCVFDGPVSAIPGMTYSHFAGSNPFIEYNIPSLPPSTYHPDGTLNTLSVNTDARLDVECRAADYAKVTQTGAQAQLPGAGRAIVNSGKYEFLCRPALEIEMKTLPANLANIKPGETITYELQATNWGTNKVTSGKAISRIPYGTKLNNALADDGTGAPGPTPPFTSGDFIGTPQLPHELSATSKPAYILDDQLLVWELGEVMPNETKTMRYSVTVATDLGQDYFSKAQLKTLTLDQTSYNFVGTANTGKRIFAFVPLSPLQAAPANADPYFMNSATGKAPLLSVAISTTNPLPKPQLQIVKHVVGPRNESLATKYARLPTDQATADVAPNVKKNDWIFYVENDTAVANDAICNYTLHYFNTGGATATNVRVKDVIPAGMTFVGLVAKDQVLMGSFPFSHFYDASGKKLDINVTANITKVRSFDLYGGDLAVNESHAFSYQCVALDTQLPGAIITSKRGGKSGSNSGLNYTPLAGYHLTADQLHFPVDGFPDAVHVKITTKASFHLLLKDGWKSGHGMASSTAPPPAPRAYGAPPPPPTVSEDDSDSITITMPYDVRGDAGAAPLPPLSNVKMTFILPKGYKTDDAYVNSKTNVKLKTLNVGAVVEGSGYVSAIRQADGRIKVTFPLDDIPFAWPTAHIIYDPLYKASLRTAEGLTNTPANVEVNITGFYGGGGGTIFNATADAATDVVTTTTPHGCVAGNWVQFTALSGGMGLSTGTPYVVHSTTSTTKLRLAEEVGGAPIDITSNAITGTKLQRLPDKPIPSVKSFIQIDSRSDPDKDGKYFIGRCAPVSVKRGDTFTYTIFIGSLVDVDPFAGEIGIKVPAGCEAVSAKSFTFNGIAVPTVGLPYEYGATYSKISPEGPYLPAGSTRETWKEVRWSRPLAAGTPVTWTMPYYRDIGGAVQITMRVLESYTGNAILDNTCYHKVVKTGRIKYPGPSAIAVRDGDVDGQLAEILQRHLQGVEFKHNTGTTHEINKTLLLDENTCGVSIGGADVLQFLNGVNLIPLPNDRVMIIGPPGNVTVDDGGVGPVRALVNDPTMRIVCSFGTTGAAALVGIPGYGGGFIPANQVLTDLGTPGLNVLASKVANVIIGGGNNLVRSGSGTFAGAGLNGVNGPALLLPNAQAVLVSDIVNAGDVKLIGQDGASVVSGGAGSAATGTGGQILAPGSAGLIGQDGASVVANDGAGIIGQDGASVLANDSASVVANDGAGLFSDQGAGLIGQDGASLIGLGGSTLTGVNTGTGK